jgi:hypothetical protein
MTETPMPGKHKQRGMWGTYIEPVAGEDVRGEAKDVWDREPREIDTGILDADGRPIMRVVRGMEQIGFVRLK